MCKKEVSVCAHSSVYSTERGGRERTVPRAVSEFVKNNKIKFECLSF